jgi:hypothetical protein
MEPSSEPPAFDPGGRSDASFGTLRRRFSATVLRCAAQTEEAVQKGRNQNDNERPELYRPA